ncbi:MAG: VWA domain-containing protein [Candidatus Lokiarchaeota archaeon]|nr:VWA domain-containing protein [Candidatus Lokiarchaeota archaeon]
MKSNVFAATDALNCDEGVRFFSEKAKETPSFMPEVYFFIRRPISKKYRYIFRRLARQSILTSSLKITSKGIRGYKRKTLPYYKLDMGEFNIDETIQHNPLKILNKTLTYKDIYGIKRKRQKRNVILILDTSGSMFGKLLLNAALTTSVLAHNLEKENYSIVLFNSTAMVLKGIKEKKKITTIIDDILDSEAVGFTNIAIGLEKGLNELNKIQKRVKNEFAILITDGNYNRGENPINIARNFPKLHVIGIPPDNDANSGLNICKEIAKAGKGKFFAVKGYREIPRTLISILSQN